MTVQAQFRIGEIAGGIFITAYKINRAIQARFVAPNAMHDFLTNNQMTLNLSALQNVWIPQGEALMHFSASDECIVRWERFGIKNRLAIQKYVNITSPNACAKQNNINSRLFLSMVSGLRVLAPANV